MVLPIQVHLPHSAWAYVRIHRRVGTNKVLSEQEIQDWVARLRGMARALHGPIFFLWGTDYEDQPIRNMTNLAQAAGSLVVDWQTQIGGARRSLKAYFSAAPAGGRGGDGANGGGGGSKAAAPAAAAVDTAAPALAPPAPAAPAPAPPAPAAPAPARTAPAAPPRKRPAPSSPSRAPAAAAAAKRAAPGEGIAKFFVRQTPPTS